MPAPPQPVSAAGTKTAAGLDVPSTVFGPGPVGGEEDDPAEPGATVAR
jgi:hypothetical protein